MRAVSARLASAKAKGPASPAAREWHALLTTAPAHLDPDSEMRKYFGTKVVAAAKAESAASGPKRLDQPLVDAGLTGLTDRAVRRRYREIAVDEAGEMRPHQAPCVVGGLIERPGLLERGLERGERRQHRVDLALGRRGQCGPCAVEVGIEPINQLRRR